VEHGVPKFGYSYSDPSFILRSASNKTTRDLIIAKLTFWQRIWLLASVLLFIYLLLFISMFARMGLAFARMEKKEDFFFRVRADGKKKEFFLNSFFRT
jgi:hypothetical protein